MEIMRPGTNPLLGSVMLVMILLAMPFSVIKARDLSFKERKNLIKAERFLIIMIYFAALFTTILIVYMSCSLIDDSPTLSENMLYIFYSISGIALFFFLWECWILFVAGAKKRPQKRWVRLSNFIIPLYAGLAIAILWESAFDLNWEADPIDVRKVILSCMLALVLILPFQRMFWYETFAGSSSGRESLRSLASIVLSWGVAVAGVL